MEYLTEIYVQCNEHLRETDRKRDQIILFYTTLLGIFIGNTDKVLRSIHGKEEILIIIYIIFFISGYVFINVILEYRLWHLKYKLSCQAIQKLMYIADENEDKINMQQVQNILKDGLNKSGKKIRFKTTETMMLNLFATINFISLIYVYYNIMDENTRNTILLVIIYVVYMLWINIRNFLGIKKIYTEIEKGKPNIWILDLIYSARI
ncbi:MAG: hypothetical protein AB9856_14870 [Cellulosilyticaceae bacterium]